MDRPLFLGPRSPQNPSPSIGHKEGTDLQTEHLRPKPDCDGFNRAIETTGTTVPALIRIFHDRNPLVLIKMDDITRTVKITRLTPITFIQVNHGWHTKPPP
jgi:hypothetical protein